MIVVSVKTPPLPFIEFIRIDLVASDDGIAPVSTPPYDITYTTDGSDPVGNPLGTAKKRRSPLKQIPINGPTTLTLFATDKNAVHTMPTQSMYLDVQDLLAKNEIHTAAPGVTNYTLAVERGDIVRTDNGIYGIVSGAAKTGQDIKEIILVENVPRNRPVGTRTQPQFGSAISRLLGQSLPFGFTQNQIQSTVFEALTYLIALQESENVPSDEQIDKILSVNVQARSPTSFRYTFSVKTLRGVVVSDSGLIGG